MIVKMAVEISVVLCAYNRAELLLRGLQALLNQDFPREAFEVIVVDDGSTDQTTEVPPLFQSRFPEGHLRYLRLEKPPGFYRSPARARNTGLRAARGGLVVFSDPEIVASPRALSIHHELHRKSPQDLIITTSPWMVGKAATAALDGIDWRADLHELRRRFPPPEVFRATVEGQWLDAHFISFKRFWAYLNGGVNERFEAWGFESTDFSRRLYWHGLQHKQDVSPEAEVYHLWHDPVKGYGDRRMALIEGLLNSYDPDSLFRCLARRGQDLAAFGPRKAYGRARLFLLRRKAEEINAIRDELADEAEKDFFKRIGAARGHFPGDSFFGLEPWVGLRHLVEWEDYSAALEWVELACREWPGITGLLVEKAKLHLKMGRREEAHAIFTTIVEREPDNASAKHGLKEMATLQSSNRVPLPPNPERPMAKPTSPGHL
ncbi:MAG: glycosyltransferase [Nitrospirae bacterium]|nr:glycosyltransferase [Nitrospirota bacterium]